MEQADLQAYKRIRDTVFEGGLKVVRDEMLGMMYKLYMYLLARSVEGTKVPSGDRRTSRRKTCTPSGETSSTSPTSTSRSRSASTSSARESLLKSGQRASDCT